MNDLKPLPHVNDWKVRGGGNRVFVESDTISCMNDYDDAWLEVTGNLSFEAKVELATHVAKLLNRRYIPSEHRGT